MTNTDQPKYPDIFVQLTGEDDNAFSIISSVVRALKRSGIGAVEIGMFRKEAMSGDYDNVLQTAMRWVEVG